MVGLPFSSSVPESVSAVVDANTYSAIGRASETISAVAIATPKRGGSDGGASGWVHPGRLINAGTSCIRGAVRRLAGIRDGLVGGVLASRISAVRPIACDTLAVASYRSRSWIDDI